MKYFSGFSLSEEEELFSDYFTPTDYTVVGFSYGAQKALEYAYNKKTRVDRLILLSPAFFQTQKPSFIRTQLRYFEAGQEAYIKQFLDNATHPLKLNLKPYLKVGSKKELSYLLSYVWEEHKIKAILNRGTIVEVFIGEKDKIIESNEVLDFFKNLCTTYLIKNAGHILRTK